MIQLNINGVALPLTSNDRYKCYPQVLAEPIEMISGRMVTEIRGTVQIVEWSYDYMEPSVYAQVLTALRSSQVLTVAYLPDDSDTMVASDFIVTSFPQPTFAFARGNKPYWHNVAFTLREVRPHD